MASAPRKHVVLGSFAWKLSERSGVMLVQMVVQTVLARVLAPADFGVIALVAVFVSLSNTFVVSGLGAALIQRRDADALDFSTVFVTSLAVASILCGVNLLAAPLVADFYDRPELVPVMRVLAASMFLTPLNIVQNALVARGLLFKKIFMNSSLATLVSGLVGVGMAVAGFGVWALVMQTVSSQALTSGLLWFSVRWRPSLQFSWIRLREMYAFSWKILVSGLLDSLDGYVRTLVIGLAYTPDMLGFYTKGQNFPNMVVGAVNGSIQSVMLPVLSSRQEDRAAVRTMMRRAMVTSSYVVFPAMAGMAALAEPLVLLLLTDKWLPVVPFLQVFCGVYALWPIHTANLQAIIAIGRSDVMLRLEVVKKAIGLVVLLATIHMGPLAMAAGLLLTGLIATFINARPNARLLDYRYREQLRDLAPAFALSALMAVGVYALHWLSLGLHARLLLQVGVGLVFYLSVSWLFRFETFAYAIGVLRDVFPKRRRRHE